MHPDAETTRRMSEKASEAMEKAGDAMDKMTDKASELERQARAGLRTAADRAQEVRHEAEREARRAMTAIEHFIREQPVTSAAIAFAAGVIATTLLRRS